MMPISGSQAVGTLFPIILELEMYLGIFFLISENVWECG